MASLQARERAVAAEMQKVRFFPMSAVGGKGSYIINEDGRRILDLSSTWGAAALGYGHPAVVEAATQALSNMPGATQCTITNEPAVALAEELLAIVPGNGDRRVWLGHAGSDANDALIRVVSAATGRSRFVCFIGGTHGGTSGGLEVSGYSPLQHQTRTSPRAGQVFVPYPDPYRPVFPGDVGQRVLDYLDYLLHTIAPPAQIAGVLIEAIMSDGGLVVPPPGFLKGLADLCKRRGILLICDEVKVGLGRTGMMHAFEADGVSPDLISFGKGLGGGLPLSALVGPAEIMNDPRGLTVMTTCGNPVCASVGRAVLRTIQSEKLVENAAARGRQLQEGLRQLANKHPLVGDVRGRGLVIGIDLVRDRQTREPATKECAKVAMRAFQLGALFYYVGHTSNVIELTPPLTLSAAEAEEGLQIIDRALTDVEAGRVPDSAIEGFAGI